MVFNTCGYGKYSVRSDAFALQSHATEDEKTSHTFWVSALKTQNSALNILGYFPGIAVFSGIYRIGFGGLLFLKSYFSSSLSKEGKHEVNATGLSQMLRGFIEFYTIAPAIVMLPVDLAVTICGINQTKNLFKQAS